MYKYFFLLFVLLCANDLKGYKVYLTFDDGPLGGTDNIIQVLEEEEVFGAFFMVGMHVERSKAHKIALERSQESIYVLLGNHSYSHAFGRYQNFYSNIEGVVGDMRKNNKVLEINSDTLTYARLPGRDVFRLPNLIQDDPYISKEQKQKEKSIYDKVYEENFLLYGWDYEWESQRNGAPKENVKSLVDGIERALKSGRTVVKNELILLMHDPMFTDAHNGKDTLKSLIYSLKEKGYTIANLQKYNTQE